jgi:hypothetical protein
MSTFDGFINFANQSGGGYLFTLITFLVFSVLFVTLSASFGWESALLSSAFIGIIISLLFSYAGLINWWITGFFVGVTIIMVIYEVWGRND